MHSLPAHKTALDLTLRPARPAPQLTNLSLAAGMTHQWYQQHFKTYPRRRAALLPWIY